MIILKRPHELAKMRQAGRIVALTLQALEEKIKPGLATIELDTLAYEMITKQGAIPSFKGYRGFPASVCVSINEEIVHGIPGKRVLCEGDIISLDLGAIYENYQGDAAITVGVGQIDPYAQHLLEVAAGALDAGIVQAVVGQRVGDISWAIQHHAESNGFSVVREYVGHGIGREMHEEPQVPNFGQPGRGDLLKPGMTLALEPMVNAGGWKTKTRDDRWTVVTADGSLSAHFEHTIAVTDGAAEILTLP
ncbi:MAG: type I methionyl aminopeptidase [Anaerolineae bacterium]